METLDTCVVLVFMTYRSLVVIPNSTVTIQRTKRMFMSICLRELDYVQSTEVLTINAVCFPNICSLVIS